MWEFDPGDECEQRTKTQSQKNLYEQGAFGGGGANGGGEGVVEGGEYVEVDDCHCVRISMGILGKGSIKMVPFKTRGGDRGQKWEY